MNILSATNIHKTFTLGAPGAPELHVLQGVDIEANEGEIISIVGASGSGKSTLLHILGGLDRPTEGSVFWNGKSIFELSEDGLARIRGGHVGFVFQFHHLLPEFTAQENVMIPLMIAGMGKNEAETRAGGLLDRVGVRERAGHKPGEMSGGEQQRVAVARAMANSPRVILADEPTGNLDSATSDQLYTLIRELNTSLKQTFIIVTHNERYASQSNRTFRMADGKLIAG
jgi:lipoprotein-releasing system ATP-binding protein